MSTTPARPTTTDEVLRDATAGGKAVRGGALRVAGYAASMALTAAASVALLRYLGVADFGRYATVTAIVTIVQGLTDAGLTVVGQREYVLRRTADEQRALLADVLGIRLVLTPVGVVLAALFVVVAGYGHGMVVGTLLAGAGVVLANAAGSLTLALGATLRFGWVTAIDLARQATIVLGILALVAAGAALTPFFATQIAGGLVALAVCAAALGRRDRVRPRFSWTEWRELLTAAAPMAASLVLNVVYLRALLVLMSLLGSEHETGLFATSSRVLDVFLGVPILMVGAAFPILVRAGADDEERLRYAMGRVTEASLVAASAVVIGLAVAAQPVVVALGGSAYREAASVLRVQAFVLLPAFLTQVAAFGLVSIHRQRALLAINAVALAAVLILGSALVPAAGDIGAAVAAVAGETALAATGWVLLARARPALRPSAAAFWRVAVAAVPAAVVALLPGIPSLVAGAVGVACFCALAWRLGAVPPELVDAIRRRSEASA